MDFDDHEGFFSPPSSSVSCSCGPSRRIVNLSPWGEPYRPYLGPASCYRKDDFFVDDSSDEHGDNASGSQATCCACGLRTRTESPYSIDRYLGEYSLREHWRVAAVPDDAAQRYREISTLFSYAQCLATQSEFEGIQTVDIEPPRPCRYSQLNAEQVSGPNAARSATLSRPIHPPISVSPALEQAITSMEAVKLEPSDDIQMPVSDALTAEEPKGSEEPKDSDPAGSSTSGGTSSQGGSHSSNTSNPASTSTSPTSPGYQGPGKTIEEGNSNQVAVKERDQANKKRKGACGCFIGKFLPHLNLIYKDKNGAPNKKPPRNKCLHQWFKTPSELISHLRGNHPILPPKGKFPASGPSQLRDIYNMYRATHEHHELPEYQESCFDYDPKEAYTEWLKYTHLRRWEDLMKVERKKFYRYTGRPRWDPEPLPGETDPIPVPVPQPAPPRKELLVYPPLDELTGTLGGAQYFYKLKQSDLQYHPTGSPWPNFTDWLQKEAFPELGFEWDPSKWAIRCYMRNRQFKSADEVRIFLITQFKGCSEIELHIVRMPLVLVPLEFVPPAPFNIAGEPAAGNWNL